jgi:hypothetical protein
MNVPEQRLLANSPIDRNASALAFSEAAAGGKSVLKVELRERKVACW